LNIFSSHLDSNDSRVYSILKTTTHPNFTTSSAGNNNDIALIKLDRMIPDSIETICLPSSDEKIDSKDKAIAVGWLVLFIFNF